MLETKSIQEELRTIVGAGNLRPSTLDDAVCGMAPRFVVTPGTEQEVAAVLASANSAGLCVTPRGSGSKMGWGNAPRRVDILLSTVRLNQLIEHAWADLTVTVEAGCTLHELQSVLARQGQRLALDGLWPERATVGGALATNDSGALRMRFGSLRDLVIGMTIALPDGTLASSGGKVVKNVAGYDLPKLVIGALGTLGVITRAVFRLHPLPRNARSFSVFAANAEDTQKFVLAIQDSKLAHVALQSHLTAGSTPVIDILFEGTEAGLAAQAARLPTLCGRAQISEASPATWNARRDLWSFSNPEETAVAKISALPTDVARSIELLRRAADSARVHWKSLTYATGLGWLRLEGPSADLHRALATSRVEFEKMGGSLVLLHRPAAFPAFDAWGTPGDSLPLMRSIKRRLD